MLNTKIVSSLEKGFSDSCINDFKELTKLSALKNERISFQLFCVSDEASDPMHPFFSLNVDGSLAKYATVRQVYDVPVSVPIIPNTECDNYLKTSKGSYPDILLPLHDKDRVRIERDTLYSFWIEIDLRSSYGSVACGETKLTVSLKNENGINSSSDITVELIDALLPPQKLIFTQWFYCDCLANYYNCEVFGEKHWKIVENFARTAKSNGINMLLTPVFTPSLDTAIGGERLTNQLVGITLENGKYSFDYSLLDRWIDMCDRVGIEYFEIAHLFTQWGARHAPKIMATVDGKYTKIFGWEDDATDERYTSFLREFIKSFLSHMKMRGDDKRCFFHISDEPSIEHIESYKAAKAAVSDLLNGYTIMDALSDYKFYNLGIVDTPIPANDHIGDFIEHNVPDLWTYYCCGQWKDVSNRFISMPSYRNRSIGMQMYKYNIVGFLHWGYNFYNTQFSFGTVNPYLDTCGYEWVPGGDTFSVYPSSDGTAIESLRIIVFYEALQDMQAMILAESLYRKDEVVRTLENAFGKEITFSTCARSSDEIITAREAINHMIKNKI